MEDRWIDGFQASESELHQEWNKYLSRLVDIGADNAEPQDRHPQPEASRKVPETDMPPAA